MDINVTMSAEEFQEFMEYRRNREQFSKELNRLRAVPHSRRLGRRQGVYAQEIKSPRAWC